VIQQEIKHMRQRVAMLDPDDPRRDRAESLIAEAERFVQDAGHLLNAAAAAMNQPWIAMGTSVLPDRSRNG